MVLLLLLPLLCGGSLQEQQRYDLQVQELVMMQEGLCVHVPCSFYLWNPWSSSSKVYIYWYNMGYSKLVATNNPNKSVKLKLQSRFFLGDPRNNCSLSIIDIRKSDTGTYIFQMETANTMKYNYQDKQLTSKVTELTEKPDILISQPLESGCPTQLTCSLPGSCEGGRPLAFSWVGPAVDSMNPQNLCSSVLTFTPRPKDHGTNLTCQVKCQGSRMTTERTIWLNVFYAAQNLTIGVSFRNVTGSPPSCRCAAEQQQGCWHLVLILIRGALMGAGFLLTYGLTWLYYTRGGGPQTTRPTS